MQIKQYGFLFLLYMALCAAHRRASWGDAHWSACLFLLQKKENDNHARPDG